MTGGIQFIQDLAVVMLVAGAAGWVFQRVGLSAIVGYIVAGMLIGPFSFYPLVKESQNIQILSQVGLVFLMFGIGMGLSIRRIRRLGPSIIVATVFGALLIFNGSRFTGLALGFTHVEALFLAGMLTVSSTAVIGKALQDFGYTHHKSGQLALGMTVLEDLVAIVVLTMLIAYVGMGEGGGAPILKTLGVLGAFVIFLGVTGLLLVPRFLRLLGGSSGSELPTLMVAALLFWLSLLGYKAGYPLALGAFLLGAVVAETPQKAQVERTFEGLRYLFSAVFFVSIGMMIGFQSLLDVWEVIFFVSLITIVGRFIASTVSLLLVGTRTRDAVRAGLTLTPVGEFSFIIAQAGIFAMVLPKEFYPLAVGVSLVTALVCPILVRHSERIGARAERTEPPALTWTLGLYHSWLARLGEVGDRSIFWRLSRKRFIQIGVGVFFVTGLLVVAPSIYSFLLGVLGRDWPFPYGTPMLFWTFLVVVALVPMVAVWRNIGALAMLYASMTSRGADRGGRIRFVVENGLKVAGAFGLFVWFWSFLPMGTTGPWVLAVVVSLGGLSLYFFRRRMVFIHSHLEVELEEMFEAKHQGKSRDVIPPWLSRHRDWDLNIKEYLVPIGAACGGKQVGELHLRSVSGCSIVAIDRQGFFIANPGPETRIYPQDRLLLLGNAEAIAAAKKILGETGEAVGPEGIEDMRMEQITVSAKSPRLYKTLAELDIAREMGVQVAGVKRREKTNPELNPGGQERLRPGDELLVLGTAEQLRNFERWLMPEENQEMSDPSDEPKI